MEQPKSVKDMNSVLQLAEVESDRGFILTMGSYLEDVTRRLVDDLVDPTRFNSFAKLIKLARDADRITSGMAELLDLVRQVRNRFAHEWEVSSLSHPRLLDLIEAMKSHERNVHKNLELDLPMPSPDSTKSYITSLLAHASVDISSSVSKRQR